MKHELLNKGNFFFQIHSQTKHFLPNTTSNAIKKKKKALLFLIALVQTLFPFNFSAFDVLLNIYSLQQMYVLTLLKKYFEQIFFFEHWSFIIKYLTYLRFSQI